MDWSGEQYCGSQVYETSREMMGDFSRSLTDGAVKLLNKAGKLGCKIKHVTGEIALYINLEYEIARFNSKGVIRPLYWGEAVGEKILYLDDDILYIRNGQELSGKLSLYKAGERYAWVTGPSNLLPSVVRQLKTKPAYLSDRLIYSKQGKTTTLIGKWKGELELVYNELAPEDLNIYMLSGRFDHPGGFNMLSIENWDGLADQMVSKGIKIGSKVFDDYIWTNFNKPWIESALQRGDDIVIWSDPMSNINLFKPFEDSPVGPTFFNRELKFIELNATKYCYDFQQGIINGKLTK